MADTRGTFRLKNVRQDILNNEYVPIPDVWINEPESVGYLKTYGSEFKLNFTTSTINTSSFLTSSRYGQFATSNPTYAWFIGGMPTISDSKKITYATDTGADNPSSRFSVPRGYGGVISGETISYFLGGAPYSFSTVSKLTHSSDTMVDLPGSHMSSSRYLVHSGHGGGAYGYFFRGMPGPSPDYSTTERITFANDTRTTLPSSSDMVVTNQHSPSSSYRVPYWGGSNLQCPTHCYYAGGTSGLPGGYNSNINQKLTFGSETWALNPSTLVNGRRYPTGMTANSVKGYLTGGLKAPNPTYAYDTESITFGTDTWATEPSMEFPSPSPINSYGGLSGTCLNDSLHPGPSGLPDKITRWVDGISDLNLSTPNNGYFIGGFNPSNSYNTTNKVDMSNDTLSQVPSNQPFVTKRAFCTGSRETGYYGGGGRSRVCKMTFATETNSNTGMIFGPAVQYAAAATGDQETGYVAGGTSTSPSSATGTSNIRKFTFATDTDFDIMPTNFTSTPRYRLAAAGNQTMGYWMGGKDGSSHYSYVSKMVYSTETVTTDTMTKFADTSPSGEPEGNNIVDMGITSTGTHAYSRGGANPTQTSRAYKLTFSSDSYEAVPAINIQQVSGSTHGYAISATGNDDSGYWAGGWFSPGNSARSWVTKVDFNTDTATYRFADLSSAPGGRLFGGNSGASPRMRGLIPRQPSPLRQPEATPTSSTTLTGPQGIKAEGYLIQGIQGSTSGSGRSDVYRLNYNTDTWDSSVFANSTLTRKRGGAASTTTAAYVGGGGLGSADGSSPTGGDMDKLTYATSTMSRIPGSDAGGIPGKSTDAAAAGNQTQGYWTFGTGDQSGCDKLVYSTETAAALPNLPWNAKNTVAVSMQTAGYYGSGDGFDDENTSFTRITFSNDTYATYSGWFYTPGGFAARYRCGSSSSTKAYIVGGQNAPRCMDVTPWATNSTSNSPTTFLQSPGFYKAPGQGSNEAGYFTGGGNTGNNGTTTEKITYASDTTAIVPSAYFSSSSPSGINSYSTGGPNMNGLGTNTPNVI